MKNLNLVLIIVVFLVLGATQSRASEQKGVIIGNSKTSVTGVIIGKSGVIIGRSSFSKTGVIIGKTGVIIG